MDEEILNMYIEFIFYIKKHNKEVKVVWNKGLTLNDNIFIELFDLDEDESISSQMRLLKATLHGNIPQKYKDYFNNKYSLDDYYLFFRRYQYKDFRHDKYYLLRDIEISYNCKVCYKDIFEHYVTDKTLCVYYENDIDFLNGENEMINLKEDINNILLLEDPKIIRKTLLMSNVEILEDKVRKGFYYFYDPYIIFNDNWLFKNEDIYGGRYILRKYY